MCSTRLRVLVDTVVADDGLFVVGLERDDRQNPLKQQAGADIVAIVILVGKRQPGLSDWQGQQIIKGLIVGGFAAREDDANRTSLTACRGVDFARKAAEASAKTLRMSSPVALAFELPEPHARFGRFIQELNGYFMIARTCLITFHTAYTANSDGLFARVPAGRQHRLRGK